MTTVLSHGCFDILHPGHVEHLKQARAMGDRLVVSVTADKGVNKGEGRPVFRAEHRAEMISALLFVDAVLVRDSGKDALVAIQPDIYVKGPDYADERDSVLLEEKALVEELGGRIAYTTGETMSSTAIAEAVAPRFSERARDYARRVRDKGIVAETVIDYLDRCASVTAYVIGEPIQDNYIYVDVEGRSAKENYITHREIGRESFEGGASIVALHCSSAGVITNRHDVSNEVHKTRYVLKPFMQKVFSTVDDVYHVGALELSGRLPADVTIVVDYGHGLILNRLIAGNVVDASKFLALNVQANSLNWGLSTLRKWPRADYIAANEMELRLGLQEPNMGAVEMLYTALRNWGCNYTALTLGHHGCVVYDGAEAAHAPSFSGKIVDRLGAGDAFLAYTAPLAYMKAPVDVLAIVGNIAGAIQVGVIGNSKPVELTEVKTWVKALLA